MDWRPILKKIDAFFAPIYAILPFTHYGLIMGLVRGHGKTILDVGCADGAFMEFIINNSKEKIIPTGIDVFSPYLEKAKGRKIYKRLIRKDIKSLDKSIGRFDVVLCSQVIEHLTKKEGLKLINNLEKIAKRRIIFIIPVGGLPQDPYDGNPYQRHKSAWYPRDFKEKGYKVWGQGLRLLYGYGNRVKKLGPFSYVFSLVSFIFWPVLNLKPEWAIYMFCWKDN